MRHLSGSGNVEYLGPWDILLRNATQAAFCACEMNFAAMRQAWRTFPAQFLKIIEEPAQLYRKIVKYSDNILHNLRKTHH
jgi:hypothetical protein